eukprot:XP_028357318.1 uncharacterized protein LOC114488031 [Physeter catodon]
MHLLQQPQTPLSLCWQQQSGPALPGDQRQQHCTAVSAAAGGNSKTCFAPVEAVATTPSPTAASVSFLSQDPTTSGAAAGGAAGQSARAPPEGAAAAGDAAAGNAVTTGAAAPAAAAGAAADEKNGAACKSAGGGATGEEATKEAAPALDASPPVLQLTVQQQHCLLQRWECVGKVGGPHALRGEVRVWSTTCNTEARFKRPGASLFLSPPAASASALLFSRVVVETARETGTPHLLLVKFKGISDRHAAATPPAWPPLHSRRHADVHRYRYTQIYTDTDTHRYTQIQIHTGTDTHTDRYTNVSIRRRQRDIYSRGGPMYSVVSL